MQEHAGVIRQSKVQGPSKVLYDMSDTDPDQTFVGSGKSSDSRHSPWLCQV